MKYINLIIFLLLACLSVAFPSVALPRPNYRDSWLRPAHCHSSRGDCVLSHDGNPRTYSWMTSSYTCGAPDISWSLSDATSISGIEISTTKQLGSAGSKTCLKVNVFVDGNKVQNVQRVTIDNAVQSFDQSASWLLENFYPRDSVSTILWSPVQGSQVKLQFSNCDGGCYTHWPISNVRFLEGTTLEPVVMSSANTVCASGTDLQTKEECEAFNGPGAGTWKGDLSGSAPHVAVHPRGCWVWSDANRHWIEPDGVLQTEALSKPICYNGTPVPLRSDTPITLKSGGKFVTCVNQRNCRLSPTYSAAAKMMFRKGYKAADGTDLSGSMHNTDVVNVGDGFVLVLGIDTSSYQNTLDCAWSVCSYPNHQGTQYNHWGSPNKISFKAGPGTQVRIGDSFKFTQMRGAYGHWDTTWGITCTDNKCGGAASGGSVFTVCDADGNCGGTSKTLGNLNIKLAPTMQKIVFDASGQLRVDAEMRKRLKGECQNINDYKVIDSVPMQQDANWQCGSNYFSEGGKSMTPTHAIKEDIKSMFSVTDEDLDINFFPQGIIQGDTGVDKRSNWCGFPSPKATGFQAPIKYWNQCVMANGGYFNTLQCTGSNNQVHAVIGIAAMNPNVCYPTHAHLNEEAYWQFGGTGTWKAWTHGGAQASGALQDENKHLNFSSHQQASLATYKDFGDNMVDYPQATSFVYYNDPLPNGRNILMGHQHPAGVVHEMSTKDGEHMAMVYWWAQNYDVVAKTKQKYHFAHYATDSCSLGRIQQVQLSTGHVVPDDLAETQCSVTQKVVTGIHCQRGSSFDTKFDRWSAHGGVLVNPLTGGRLFEMECTDFSCVGFPGGQTAPWWITCGYSWKNMDDLDDNDQVIVDVRTETYQMKHDNYRPHGACDSSWAKAVPVFPKQGWEKDNGRGRGLIRQWAFQLCYKQESWSNVKKSGNDVVTDLHARTSRSVAGVKWNDVGHGGCTGGTWMYIGTANSLDQAKQLMLNHPDCSKDGSMLFYSSSYSHDPTRGVRCTKPEHVAECPENNKLWQEYILTQNDGYKRIGDWYKPGSGQNSVVYGDNKAFTEWIYLFSKKEHFSSTGGPLVGAGRRKLATSRLLSDTF